MEHTEIIKLFQIQNDKKISERFSSLRLTHVYTIFSYNYLSSKRAQSLYTIKYQRANTLQKIVSISSKNHKTLNN